MNKILFIDTVTTGVNTEHCAIYKMGGIYVEGTAEKKRFDFHIHPFPYARISDNSLWVSGETRTSISKYPEEDEAFNDFVAFLDSVVSLKSPTDKLYLAGYNASAFDAVFLRELFKRQGSTQFRNYFHVQVIDLMSLAAFVLMDRRSGMPDFCLENAAKYLGVEPTINKQYSCIDNAETCLKMYNMLRVEFCPAVKPIEFGNPDIETITNF